MVPRALGLAGPLPYLPLDGAIPGLAPTLLVTTDPAAGLAAERVAWLLEWAAGTAAAAEAEQLQLADTAYTGGSRAVTSDHVAPASPEPNTSPVVEPK